MRRPNGGTLYVIPTYTAMLEVRDLLARWAGRGAFWERPDDEPKQLKLRVAHLYPKQMNIYGDRGNILCPPAPLPSSAASSSRSNPLEIDDRSLSAKDYDLIFIGGAQDREQRRVADDLVKVKGKPLRRSRRSATSPSSPSAAAISSWAASTAPPRGRSCPAPASSICDTAHPGPAGRALHRQRRHRMERRRRSSASRTTAGARTSASAPSRSAASSPASATTARTAARAPSIAMSSAPTSTARCCRRTRSSPTT